MRIQRWLRSDEGSVLVEFAMVLLILSMLVFGIIDFGRALYIQNNLTSAAREGARFASVQADPSNAAAIDARVKSYVVSVGGDSVTTAMIGIVLDRPLPNTQYVTVSINGYPFTPITPLGSLITLAPITISATATFRWERAP